LDKVGIQWMARAILATLAEFNLYQWCTKQRGSFRTRWTSAVSHSATRPKNDRRREGRSESSPWPIPLPYPTASPSPRTAITILMVHEATQNFSRLQGSWVLHRVVHRQDPSIDGRPHPSRTLILLHNTSVPHRRVRHQRFWSHRSPPVPNQRQDISAAR